MPARARARARLVCVVTGLGLLCATGSCKRSGSSRASGKELARATAPSASAPASTTSRPGMVYVPAGTLLAGTPVDAVPRIAEEELPGTHVDLGGFFIDQLPYPDEPGAIATTNVSRDEASALCAARSKRLCTELEWERACKGPANTAYEDGDELRPATCGLGLAADLAAKRPTGDLPACVSGFGVREMHGGAWEWTAEPWNRGGRKDLGVLKGGNAVAGELAGRCANSLARPPTTKSPSMGFRCCAGPKNDARVSLATPVAAPLERSARTDALTAPWLPFAREAWPLKNPAAAGASVFAFRHAFIWHPVANETLIVASGCGRDYPRPVCGVLVGRTLDGGVEGDAGTKVRVLAHVETGYEVAEVTEAGDTKRLRYRGADATSPYLRDLVYAYGRIEVGPIRR